MRDQIAWMNHLGGTVMPTPKAIADMGQAAFALTPIPLPLGKGNRTVGNHPVVNRTFHPYLELTMQGKHDSVINGHCKRLKLNPRNTDGTQVNHQFTDAQQALGDFYVRASRVAVDVVADQMTNGWNNQGAQSGPVFTPQKRVDAHVQNQIQVNGLYYEISYWYDKQDIYVLFHCYPPKNSKK